MGDMRRNDDKALREIERDYVASRAISDATRLALARRRSGVVAPELALRQLLSDVRGLALVADHEPRWGEERVAIERGAVVRVWRFRTGPGAEDFEYVRRRADVPDFAEDPEPRTIRVALSTGEKIHAFEDVTEAVGPELVPTRTVSFVSETTRFMLWELLVRPRLANPPFDLRRDLGAHTVADGRAVWATGEGNVSAITASDVGLTLRTVSRDSSMSAEHDPRSMFMRRRTSTVRVRPFTLVVRDEENMSVTVGVRFSPVLPTDPYNVWDHLRREYDAADRRADEEFPHSRTGYRSRLTDAMNQIFLDWARANRPDRVSIHEADAIEFAMESPL